ncbi:MAG: hypothetical protein Athens071426_684 [Parcubacteria group bacterium Athens0714_26]|nr:MAG: hypothetical protein Athens101426_447 [Parcubacteria group bacterium Athens1014_26]TSD01339.1 MAG: hypothetical protein Athens071426_684 [Parcubacteria group bacterium Athens0714_26]
MKIDVVVLDKRAEKLKPLISKKAKELAGILRLNGHLEIFLVGNKQMKKNVLSYVASGDFPRPDIKQKALGEIYLNPSFIKKNKENLLFMLLHGVLHIAGYDHKKKSDRIKMEKKENILFLIIKSS